MEEHVFDESSIDASQNVTIFVKVLTSTGNKVFSDFYRLSVPQNATMGGVKEAILQHEGILQEVSVYLDTCSLQLNQLHLFRDRWLRKELLPDSSLLVQDHGYIQNLEGLPEQQWQFKSCLYLGLDLIFDISMIPRPKIISTRGTEEASTATAPASTPAATETLYLPVLQSGCFSDLRLKLQQETGIPVERLHVLDSNHKECHHGSPSLMKINTRCFSVWVNEWILHVRTLQCSFSVGVDANDTLDYLESVIRKQGSFSRKEVLQILTSDGMILNPTSTAEEEEEEEEEIPDDHKEDKNGLAKLGLCNRCTIYVIPAEYDKNLLDALQQQQSYRSIPKPEHRGITLVQLRQIVAHIILRCRLERWKSTNPRHEDDEYLMPEEVTLYDLMEHFIRPVTTKHHCSYVELIAAQASTSSESPKAPAENQLPQYFCSHYWGESVLNFVACLEQHARDRNISDTTPYWVCAYALNQHGLSGEIMGQGDPMNSPFLRAMELTKGTISILDANATCYSRIWCTFEISLVLNRLKERQAGYLYDIYAYSHNSYNEQNTNGRGGAVGITDGLVASDGVSIQDRDRQRSRDAPLTSTDGNFERRIQKFYEAKCKRESFFPIATCHRALAVQLEKANATVAQDRTVILNSIIGASGDSLHAAPPASHQAYDYLNNTLRAKFAESVYRVVVENADPRIQDFREALMAGPYSSLVMSFAGCSQFQNEARFFVESLPRSLTCLELVFDMIEFEDAEEFASGLGLLGKLRRLKFNIRNCKALVSADILWKEIGALKDLEELHLDLFGCSNLSSIDGIDVMLSGLPLLTSLYCNLGNCKFVPTWENLFQGLAAATHLSTCDLHLFIRGETDERSLDGLGDALGSMPDLEEFSLRVGDCTAASLTSFAAGLCRVVNITSLKLDLTNCDMAFAGLIGRALALYRGLRVLEMTFQGCSQLTSIQDMFQGHSSTNNLLESLCLDFKNCSSLACIHGVGAFLRTRPMVKKLALCFHGCRLSSIVELAPSFEECTFPNLEVLSLDFGLNSTLVIENDTMFFSSAKVPQLKSLVLHFPRCCGTFPVSKMAREFLSMDHGKLDTCLLDFGDMTITKDEDVLELYKAVSTQINVSTLFLRFPRCRKITSRNKLLQEVSRREDTSAT